jgi:hypothetical protein
MDWGESASRVQSKASRLRHPVWRDAKPNTPEACAPRNICC